MLLAGACPARAEWLTFQFGSIAANEIRAIAEDPSERIWVATGNAGLRMYDGVAWTAYGTVNTSGSLRGTVMRSAYRDRSGAMWFGAYHPAQPLYPGNEGGVTVLQGGVWSHQSPGDDRWDNTITAISEGRGGIIWLGTAGGGLYRREGSGWEQITRGKDARLPADSIQALFLARDSTLWIGTSRGAASFNGATLTPHRFGLDGNGNFITSICQDQDGILWFGSYNGVVRYDGSSWTRQTVSSTAGGLGSDVILTTLADREGRVWFGTVAGVSRLDGQSWRTYTTSNTPGGLPDDEVLSMLQDHLGALWFGTRTGGLARFDGVGWAIHNLGTGSLDDDVRAAVQDSSGRMWFGTHNMGAYRFDGATWTHIGSEHGLAADDVRAVLEDTRGRIWLGTYGGGVSVIEGSTLQPPITEAEGLGGNYVLDAFEDRSGNVWFAHFGAGVSRFDDPGWTRFTTADGLALDNVGAIAEAPDGRVWFGTLGAGLSHYDPATGQWTGTDLSATTGLPRNNNVNAIHLDTRGFMWIATDDGVLCHDTATGLWSGPFRRETTGGGLPANPVQSIAEDRFGDLWFGTILGASRFDREAWRALSRADGLAGDNVQCLIAEESGALWFGTREGGASRYERDRVAPHTLILRRPPPLSTSRQQSAAFDAAYGEVRMGVAIEFSYRLDGGFWSAWSRERDWLSLDVPDGAHRFQVRARDPDGNVDPLPAEADFEVDSEAPAPQITAPRSDQVVRDSVTVLGTADDLRFSRYALTATPGAGGADLLLAESAVPVRVGALGGWNTRALPDGVYEIRVVVEDSLHQTGADHVTVIVDNNPPWADETSPVLLSAESGGDIYTTHGELHLYFPPNALSRDAIVTLERSEIDSVPSVLPSGSTRLDEGYRLAWAPAALEKAATLEVALPAAPPAGRRPAVHYSANGTSWERLGGTWEARNGRISLPIRQPGRYAIFAESAAGAAGSGKDLADLSFTPRVFSPRGAFAAEEVGIGFSLGRPGRVTLRVYDRAGRFIRELLAGVPLSAGANLVRWDGRNHEGSVVHDGVYIVTVEALGRRLTRPLAVVR